MASLILASLMDGRALLQCKDVDGRRARYIAGETTKMKPYESFAQKALWARFNF